MSDVSVTVAARSVELGGERSSVTASVTNAAAEPQRIVLECYGVAPAAVPAADAGEPPGPPVDAAAWTTIERPLREIPAGTTEQYVVSIGSAAAPVGAYDIKLIAYPADRAPEEYADHGQVVRVVVPAGPPPPPPKKRPWPFVVIAVAVVLLISAVAFALTRGGSVIVPDVVGEQSADAEATLREAGLDVAVEAELGPEPLGVVLRQVPVAGSELDAGSAVLLVVRVGVFLPDVTGAPIESALARLGDSVTVTQEPQESDAPPGTVVEMDPVAGAEVPPGAAVRLLVATPRTVEVPALIGKDLISAQRELEAIGLVGTARPGPSCTTFRICTVIGQGHEPGRRVSPGTAVTLETL